jgi:transketolase
MRNTFAEHLLVRAKEDSSIILITGDLGYGVLDKFQKELPHQFINAGVAEQSMMSMAAGLASRGYRPFVYSIANFPTFRCLEQIRNDVCYMKNPVTIVSVGAGLSYGPLGYTHHAIEDLAVLRVLPNLEIYSPSGPSETIFAINELLNSNAPSYLRLGKGGERELNSGNLHALSSLNVIQKGPSGVICWTGAVGAIAFDALTSLAAQSIFPTLISVPSLSDESLRKVLRIADGAPLLSLEEHVLPGGFGSWLLEIANSDNYLGSIGRIGINSKNYSLVGSQDFLLSQSNISAKDIAVAFMQLIGNSPN